MAVIANLIVKVGAQTGDLKTDMAKAESSVVQFRSRVVEADTTLAAMSTTAGRTSGEVTKLSGVATSSVGPFNTLRGSLNQFDGALSAMGVKLGPEIRALGEFGDVAGKSAKDVGLLGTAGLAFAAAMGGWKIGRLIAEFFDLDTKIANTTARLLGYGNVGAQTAGAVQDTINLAISRGASTMVTYSEAIQHNSTFIKNRQGVVKAAADEEKGIADARAAWLRKAQADEEAAAQKLATLRGHLFGTELVTKANEYAKALGGVDNISKLMPAAQAELNKIFGAAYDALVKAGQGASAAATQFDVLRTATTNWTAINASIAAMPDPFAKQLQERRQGIRDTEVAIMNQNAGLSASERYWAHAGEIADAEMSKAASAVASVGPAAAAAAGSMQQSFSFAFSGIRMDADATAKRVAMLNSDADINLRRGGIAAELGFWQRRSAQRLANDLPEFANGVTNFSGGPAWVGERGPEIVNLPRGSSVTPNGGGGVTVTIGAGAIVINTSGASAARDGRTAADALTTRLKGMGVRV